MLRLYENLTSYFQTSAKKFPCSLQNMCYTAMKNNPDLFHQAIAIR